MQMKANKKQSLIINRDFEIQIIFEFCELRQA